MIDNRSGLGACPPFDQQTSHAEIFEFWPSDMQRIFAMAGLPRRRAPALASGCEKSGNANSGQAPRITSPLSGVNYTLRAKMLHTESIPLQATIDGDVQEAFWFVNNSYIGSAKRGGALSWQPKKPGHFLLRVVDELGRVDSREVNIEVTK
jgi:penicillin-binding protein 1C